MVNRRDLMKAGALAPLAPEAARAQALGTRYASDTVSLGLAASAEGCSTKVIGQIVLVIQTDLSLPKDIDTIRIEVKGADGHSVFGAIEQRVQPAR